MVGRAPELDRPAKKLVYIMEAAIAYPLYWLIGRLPLRTASGLGGWLGRVIGYRLGITQKARANIKRALPELTDENVEAVLIGMWDNLGRTLFEFPNLEKIRFDGPNPDVLVEGREYLERMRDDGKAGIFYAAHLANWEILMRLSTHVGLPVHGIYRAPNNPLVDNLFRKRSTDPNIVSPKGAEGAKKSIAALRDGGHIAMMVDQKMNDGISAPFMGIPAMTASALAVLALKFGCPVTPVRIERLEGPTFKITFFKPVFHQSSGKKKADVLAAMTEVNKNLSDWIRDKPEQWLWLHNRWPKE